MDAGLVVGPGRAAPALTCRAVRIVVAGVAMVATVLNFAGCSTAEPFVPPTPAASVAQACDAVMAALPATVAGQPISTPSGRYWRSWGDPAITLSCGVPAPADLSPTSRCDVINDVGWFSVDERDGYRFTTIGRQGFIEVTVPHAYAPEGDALVDLSAAVALLPQAKPCQ